MFLRLLTFLNTHMTIYLGRCYAYTLRLNSICIYDYVRLDDKQWNMHNQFSLKPNFSKNNTKLKPSAAN